MVRDFFVFRLLCFVFCNFSFICLLKTTFALPKHQKLSAHEAL